MEGFLMDKITKIYLAHSIHEREIGKKIQDEIATDPAFIVLNPFDQEFNKADIDKLNENKSTDWSWKDKYITSKDDIVDNDLRMVAEADIIICVFPNDISVGIPCEMTFAWMMHKPIIAIVPDRLKEHPWINKMARTIKVRKDW